MSSTRDSLRPLSDPASNEALAEKYGAVPYAAQSNALSHPDRLATVAALYGLSAASPATCSVLELGCSDGANLLSMAASLSAATFVGCDLSAAAIQIARDAVNHSGLANVTLVHGDLRELPRDLGPFDFIVAHGVYSWVPPSVRDGLFSLAHERLAPNGLMFVSYNVYPGCHVRQAVWEALRFHAGNLESAHDRLDAARALAGALADPARVQDENDATRAGTVLRLRLPAALPSKRSLPRRAGSRDRMDAAERAVHACGRLALADPRGGAIATAAQSEPTRGARGQRIDEYVRQFARLGLLIG